MHTTLQANRWASRICVRDVIHRQQAGIYAFASVSLGRSVSGPGARCQFLVTASSSYVFNRLPNGRYCLQSNCSEMRASFRLCWRRKALTTSTSGRSCGIAAS